MRKRFKAAEVFNFLKKALKAGKSPHRGLNGFGEEDWLYRNEYAEKRGFLEGEERIYYKEQLVYILIYNGGQISDKRTYLEWSKKLLNPSELVKNIKF
jgi:hypothetical protein